MVKKLLALAAVLVLGCASVFASGDVDVQLIDEMDFDEFYETFSNADEASDYFDLDLEECYDYSVIDEFFETRQRNWPLQSVLRSMVATVSSEPTARIASLISTTGLVFPAVVRRLPMSSPNWQ